MRAVLQRVSRAAVRVDSKTVGQIGKGLVVLVGIAAGDTEESADTMAEKIASLRIFPDAEGKMNLSIRDMQGSVLETIGKTGTGEAEPLYEYFLKLLRERGLHVECGVFGAMMEVELVNDGPVTILLDSKLL